MSMSVRPPLPHHNRFMALFPGLPMWAGARRELLDFMVQGKIYRGRHTDHPAGRHSIQTNQCPTPPIPHFLQVGCPSCRPTFTVSKHCQTASINGRSRLGVIKTEMQWMTVHGWHSSVTSSAFTLHAGNMNNTQPLRTCSTDATLRPLLNQMWTDTGTEHAGQTQTESTRTTRQNLHILYDCT